MAPKSVTAPPKLSLLLLVVAMFIPSEAYDLPLKETKMTLHFQDYNNGPNTTVVVVTGIPNKAWWFNSFGTIVVADDKITQGPDKNSPEIGRAQGIFATSSLDDANTHVMFSIVFTNKEYNGSTLELQGRSVQLAPAREISVVGGTGKFRFARGFATFETFPLDPSILYNVLRCNVTVLHY